MPGGQVLAAAPDGLEPGPGPRLQPRRQAAGLLGRRRPGGLRQGPGPGSPPARRDPRARGRASGTSASGPTAGRSGSPGPGPPRRPGGRVRILRPPGPVLLQPRRRRARLSPCRRRRGRLDDPAGRPVPVRLPECPGAGLAADRSTRANERRWWAYTVIPPGPGHPQPVAAVAADAGIVLWNLSPARRPGSSTATTARSTRSPRRPTASGW